MQRFPEPRKWTISEIEHDAEIAREIYAERRPAEGREAYHTAYWDLAQEVLSVFAESNNLHSLPTMLEEYPGTMNIARYLCAPPISEDDLATVTGHIKTASSMEAIRARADAIVAGLDQMRFPWLASERDPTPDERSAAIQTTAALMAAQSAMTVLRNRWAKRQEAAVADVLEASGYERTGRRRIMSFADLPTGQFCPESMVFGTKSDVPVGLKNGRYLLIECKVSGSEVNSYKRLNHETVNKRSRWLEGFGGQAYTAAVLSGVFRPQNVLAAQEAGVFIFWEHELQPLAAFLAAVG